MTLPDEDRFSAVFGNDDANLEASAPVGAYNNVNSLERQASTLVFDGVPELAADTYATIGWIRPPRQAYPGLQIPASWKIPTK